MHFGQELQFLHFDHHHRIVERKYFLRASSHNRAIRHGGRGDCEEREVGKEGERKEGGEGEGTALEDGNPGGDGGAADDCVSKALKLQRADTWRAPLHPASPPAHVLLGEVLTVQL